MAFVVSPLLRDLLGDPELEELFSPETEIVAMLAFEKALADAQAAEGVIPAEAAAAIARACDALAPDIEKLAPAIARDGVVVPELVKQLRAATGEPHAIHAHKGSTSQDVIDTGLVLRLKQTLRVLEARIVALIANLEALSARDGAKPLMGRTRMQRARPITTAHKIEAWRAPFARHLERLKELRPRLLRVQLGGAVGNRAELGEKADSIADRVADALGLHRASSSWHAQRDAIVELGQWLALVAGQCGKIGVDIGLMAQNEVGEARLASGGGSSAMPDKNNPVKAEILVALARFAATLAGGLHHSLVHENERSGAAWTLEWLILPQLVIAAGAALRNAALVIEDVSFSPT